MVSYVHLVTTKPQIKRIAQSLNIPTVRAGKVIKVKPEQLTHLIAQESKKNTRPLFHDENSNNSMDFDLKNGKEEQLCYESIKHELDYDNQSNTDMTLNSLNNYEPSLDFIQKNIKQEPVDFDFNFDDIDLTKPLNSNGDDLDLNLFSQTVPNSDPLSGGIISADQIFQSIGYNEQDLEKMIADLSPKNLKKSLEFEKPNFSKPSEENKTCQVKFEPIENSICKIFTSPNKKRRKNIYRADDIRNEEDLLNYLERRKKNNISSKYSRANKKRFYHQLDVRSHELENENEKLKVKAVEMEKLNNYLKKYLIDNFSINKIVR